MRTKERNSYRKKKMTEFKVQKDRCELVTLDKVLWFGKHKGKTIRQVIESGEGKYIQWAIKKELFELDCNGEDFLSESLPVEEPVEEPDDRQDFNSQDIKGYGPFAE